MNKFIKENIVFAIALILLIGFGGYYTFNSIQKCFASYQDRSVKQEELNTKNAKLESIRQQKANSENQKKKEAQSGKVIYEVLGQQFSSEASFGIIFENILSHITNTGLRVRSIDYNYAPQDDKILMTNAQGYNACELGFVTVGNYSQLQKFFKNIAKEKYLSNINELYIEPYDKDKTILIARFKIRLYTKTI